MRFVFSRKIMLSLLWLHSFPLSAYAIPAITCHCFTERAYDAAHPAAADPYFLATAQNSFFASVFKTEKKSVVMKKQQGASSDDLWIAYWVAAQAGVSAESLLQAKQGPEGWEEMILPLRISPQELGAGFAAALHARAATVHLAETVVDELFRRHQILNDRELTALRQEGASSQELIITAVIAARTRQPARELYLQVKAGSRSWGSLLSSAGIDTSKMSQEMAGLLKLPFR